MLKQSVHRGSCALTSTWLVVALSLSGLSGCSSQTPENTGLEFAVANRNAKNIALLVGAPNDLPGVRTDIVNVARMIRQSDLGYEVVELNNASRSQILSAADNVGRSITAESTVFFYFSGHGAESGTLIPQGYGSVTLKEVASTISRGINGGRFTRFIGVIDACFSGQSVDGNQAIFLAGNSIEQTNASSSDINNFSVDQFATALATASNRGLFDYNFTGNSAAFAKGNPPFSQGLVLAAARKFETSLDGGSAIGGVFTASWLSAIKSNSNATVGQILERSKQLTIRNSGGSHVPVWKAMPESFLNEQFNGGGSLNPAAPATPATPDGPGDSNVTPQVNPVAPGADSQGYEQLLSEFLQILVGNQ